MHSRNTGWDWYSSLGHADILRTLAGKLPGNLRLGASDTAIQTACVSTFFELSQQCVCLLGRIDDHRSASFKVSASSACRVTDVRQIGVGMLPKPLAIATGELLDRLVRLATEDEQVVTDARDLPATVLALQSAVRSRAPRARWCRSSQTH